MAWGMLAVRLTSSELAGLAHPPPASNLDFKCYNAIEIRFGGDSSADWGVSAQLGFSRPRKLEN